jgi:hypothetical protein
MRTRAAQPLRGFSFSSIVITLCGGQAPGQGRRIEDTMPHDKIKAAARRRVAETGESYAAARRAVVTEHQGGGQIPSPGAGYALAMSGEIHDWLAGLRGSNPPAALRVAQALAALMEEGAAAWMIRWWSPRPSPGPGCWARPLTGPIRSAWNG